LWGSFIPDYTPVYPDDCAPTRSRLAWGVAALLTVIAAIALAFLYLRPSLPATAVQRFELNPPVTGRDFPPPSKQFLSD